jgi:hypothetical protein
MKIDRNFLIGLKKNNIMDIKKVPYGHNVYEYAIKEYDEGSVFGFIELEHQIIDVWDNIIGHFGINFEHKILVYYMKE